MILSLEILNITRNKLEFYWNFIPALTHRIKRI